MPPHPGVITSENVIATSPEQASVLEAIPVVDGNESDGQSRVISAGQV